MSFYEQLHRFEEWAVRLSEEQILTIVNAFGDIDSFTYDTDGCNKVLRRLGFAPQDGNIARNAVLSLSMLYQIIGVSLQR